MRISFDDWRSARNHRRADFRWRVGSRAGSLWRGYGEYFDNELEALVYWHNQREKETLTITRLWRNGTWRDITPQHVNGD